DRALARAGEVAQRAKGSWVGLVSAGASCEALDLAGALLKANGGSGSFRVTEGDERPLANVPDLALRKERAANVYGALEAGFTRDWTSAVGKAKTAGL